MKDYNLFWTAFAAIGQAVGAMATSAAVIITLWQIRYANKKRLKLQFSDNNIVFSENGNLEYHFVSLTVTNIGNRNVIVTSWGIKVSKKQNLLIVPDMKSPVVKIIQKPLPCTLKPEETVDLVFDIKLFLRNLREQIKEGVFSEKDRLVLYAVDSTGKKYCVKSQKSIKKYISDNIKYE